ncbi:MAG: hypothetical protein GEU73_12375 [Chloroflexi bacterium]|nr:hypothetical protein [Chloroflexota bacterium]
MSEPLFRKVDAIQIPVPDLDAGLAFYRDRHRVSAGREPPSAGAPGRSDAVTARSGYLKVHNGWIFAMLHVTPTLPSAASKS